MDGMFRGRDNSETHVLKFSASSVATWAWKRAVTSQMLVAAGTRSSVEGAGRTAAVRRGLQKQDILGICTILDALNLFEVALHLRVLPTSNAQPCMRWGNLSHLSGKGGCTSETKPVRSQALASFSAPSSQYKFGVTQGKASMYKSEPHCGNWTQPRLSFSIFLSFNSTSQGWLLLISTSHPQETWCYFLLDL